METLVAPDPLDSRDEKETLAFHLAEHQKEKEETVVLQDPLD